MRHLKAVIAAAAVALLLTSCVRAPAAPPSRLPTNETLRGQVIAYDTGIRRAVLGEHQGETPVRKVITNVCEYGGEGTRLRVELGVVTSLVSREAEWNKELVAAFQRKMTELGFEARDDDEPGTWGYDNPVDDFAVELSESSDSSKTLQLRVSSPCVEADGSAPPPAAA
ncbi:hypothetical protein HUT16_26170 [Kitasatospora sp. NA04385]|uniref:hypothetical protein n=1 Tax=Kitasatospora sp. NA04385 TaxID=2742135 RepID=UPI0015919EE0|nr:hypothetical protein [Kitasatospora sp. NA04385]QKW22090.1 hypothetical protein HUT16_26170 [Kitasatospora sp. NA04385]